METIGRDVAVLLWEPWNNRSEEKDETTKPNKHSQDVY